LILNPKRAQQATSDTRDAMFSKLNAYIQLFFGMGKVPWKTYNDIPASAIYNIDEVGNNTTIHRNKFL